MQARDAAQHHQHEQHAGRIKTGHQVSQRHQCGNALRTDGIGHGTQRTQRRQLHDEADDTKHHMRQAADRIAQHSGTHAHDLQRKAHQHRHQQHLQHIAARKRIKNSGGNDVEQKRHHALMLRLLGVLAEATHVEASHIHMQAHAGLQHIDDCQAQHQRQRGDQFEIAQRIEADAADATQIVHAGDAQHHRTEDDRRDDHLDQADEAITQRL